MDANSVVILLG